MFLRFRRLDDVSTDGLNLIEEIRVIFDNYDYQTEILASIYSSFYAY